MSSENDQEVNMKREEIENIEKDIGKYRRLIEELRLKKHYLENALYYICEHIFVYDTSSSFDDTCKYVCKKCNLYDNDYMYQ